MYELQLIVCATLNILAPKCCHARSHDLKEWFHPNEILILTRTIHQLAHVNFLKHYVTQFNDKLTIHIFSFSSNIISNMMLLYYERSSTSQNRLEYQIAKFKLATILFLIPNSIAAFIKRVNKMSLTLIAGSPGSDWNCIFGDIVFILHGKHSLRRRTYAQWIYLHMANLIIAI